MELNKIVLDLVGNLSSELINLEGVVIVILKPDFPSDEKHSFNRFCKSKSLNVVANGKSILNRYQILGIYSDIFRLRSDDKKYGAVWKIKLLEYMQSGTSEYFLIEGENAQFLLKQYKTSIRKQYDKITDPATSMDETEFEEKVVRNLIHVTNEDEFVSSCWLLFI